MKTCLYCGAENRDDAIVCYSCGNSFGTIPYPPPPAESAEPTQPVRTRIFPPPERTPGPYDTQHIPRVSYPAEDPYAAQRNYPPPAQTQSWSSLPPTYIPPPAYLPPPPPPPDYNRGTSRIWPVVLLGLGALLLFACGFAFWTLSYATNAGANRLRVQLATQVAGAFGGAGISLPGPLANPGPAGSGQPANGQQSEPTPWPTFTPAPDGQPTPDATQAGAVEKLLSESCKTSLDRLDKLSSQITSQPTVALDATWRSDLSQAVADMKTNCGTIDEASPVPGLVTQAHQDLAKSQSEFDQAGKLFDEGVKNLDPGKLLEAGQHVQSAVKYLNTAMAELKKIGR